ncbi:VOC family protein (plasmid) [Embleya sp. NBC_00888]|uniref:VOC family protein n=1 Tax=Embleya sp. NBC_00888 TaxID=2975960 RepID=UPI002F911C8A|nr:VOC family protein [Embleya sp. NBC_00888]
MIRVITPAPRLAGATSLLQICFVVDDLYPAMANYSTCFGAGPWFLGPEPTDDPNGTVYGGVPTPLGARIALSYTGHLMIELVEPLPGSTTVFSDRLAESGPGLHHFGFGTRDFDATVRELAGIGRLPVFSSLTPRGARIVMVADAIGHGGLEEYIELTPEGEAFYATMRAATANWDGKNLIWNTAAAAARPPQPQSDRRPHRGEGMRRRHRSA